MLTGEEAVNLQKETAFKEMISPLEQRRMKYLKRKQVHGDRDTEVGVLKSNLLYHFILSLYRGLPSAE